jgi:hypothetical protein
MELEQPATDSAEVADTPAPSIFDTDTTEAESDTDLQEQAPEEEDAEDEIDGVKLRGKKELLERIKSERLMQSDYTRKTQEVAEQRKAFEIERAQHQQVTQTYLREVAQIVATDERLNQFQKVDWQALSDSDPVQAQKLYFEFQQLQGTRSQLQNSLTQRQQHDAMQAQQTTAKRLQEARAVVEREIKGWSPELDMALKKTAMSVGFSEDEARVSDPRTIKLVHKAYLYDQLVSQRAKPAAPPPPPPVTRVTGAGATSTRKLSEMSDADYAAARRSYIAKHR